MLVIIVDIFEFKFPMSYNNSIFMNNDGLNLALWSRKVKNTILNASLEGDRAIEG